MHTRVGDTRIYKHTSNPWESYHSDGPTGRKKIEKSPSPTPSISLLMYTKFPDISVPDPSSSKQRLTGILYIYI